MYVRHFSSFLIVPFLTFFLAAGFENAAIATGFKSLGPFGGDVRSLLIDSHQPQAVYLGTSNGMIFKSADMGKSWDPLYPGIGRPSLVIDTLVPHPREPNHLYAGAWDLQSDGGGLYESKDGGLSWSRVMLPKPDSAIRGLSICQTKPEFMIVGTLDGAYASTDGGRSWKKVGGNELQKAESVAIDPIDPRILYVGTWRLGYKSADFGRTWVRIDAGMPLDSDVFSITVDPHNSGIVYSSACSGVYRSTNQAGQWTRLKLLPDRLTVRAQVVYIDPTNSRRIYSGTTEGLFVSNNDGQNWTRVTSAGVTVNAIQVNPENFESILIGTEYDGVLSSTDGGRTWKESNEGFIHRQISWIKSDPDSSSMVAGLTSGAGGLFSLDMKTGRWAPAQILPGMRILSFLVLPQNRGRLAGTTQGLYWQARGSDAWTKLKGLIAKRTILSLECDPNYLVVYAGTDRGVYRTSVAALDFRIPPATRLSPEIRSLVVSPGGNGAVYAGSSLGLLRSWDRGTTWGIVSSYGIPDRAVIQSIAISALEKEHLFAGTSAGLYESTDGGVGWRRAGDGTIGMTVPSVMFLDGSDKRVVALDGNSGTVYYSRNGGGSWDTVTPKHPSPATCLSRDPQATSRVYVGTKFHGVYQLEVP
jgi:photosystem II stability/assembly factor-like uncharacterized protein